MVCGFFLVMFCFEEPEIQQMKPWSLSKLINLWFSFLKTRHFFLQVNCAKAYGVSWLEPELCTIDHKFRFFKKIALIKKAPINNQKKPHPIKPNPQTSRWMLVYPPPPFFFCCSLKKNIIKRLLPGLISSLQLESTGMWTRCWHFRPIQAVKCFNLMQADRKTSNLLVLCGPFLSS